MISSIISRLVILVFGTLYPAYASYKAVRTKNVKEYVKWMMYWIVFALFTCAETFTDVFCSFWFPFYYEFKVILVIWLLSPATKGSSILYRKFVHPMLTKREQEIDEYIAKAKEQGYHTVLTLGSKGVNYATTVIMQTAIKGGGGLVNQLRRSYSLSDISADMDALAEMNRIKALPEDELDIGDTPLPKDARLRRSRGYSPRRSASGSGRVEMYFPEVDVNVRQRGTRPRETGIPLSHIRSNEDVSSGYSSAEMLYSGHPPVSEAQEPLVRTSSVGSSRVTRTKVARGGAVPKRPTAAEDNLSWSESEESDSGMQEEHFYDVAPASIPETTDTVLSAATSQSTGSDFKSHLPVALEGGPTDKPVSPPEKFLNVTNLIQNLASNSAIELLEEGITDPVCYSNEEDNGNNIIGEILLDEKPILEEEKCQEGDFNTQMNDSELTVGADSDCQPFDKEVPTSTSEVPCMEVVAKTEDLNDQEIISLPKPTDCKEVLIETSSTPTICMPQEPEEIEFFDTESDTIQNTMAEISKIHVSASSSEASKENESVNNMVTSFPDFEKINSYLNHNTTDFIPTTVHCDEMMGTENTSKNTTQDPEDNEFFDTETDVLQHPIALLDSSNVVNVTLESTPPGIIEVQNEEMLRESNVETSGDDPSKEGRAGRYNKHPAPSPPLKASAEDLQLITNKDEVESESSLGHELVPDHKSPSHKRNKSRSKSPQCLPSVNETNTLNDKNEHKSCEIIEEMAPIEKVNSYNPGTSHADTHDMRPSEYYYNQYRAQASPKPSKKETKSRQDTRFFSRILSKPRSTLASFLPFFSSSDEPQTLSDAMTTSLTSLDDMRAQERMRSSSLAGNMPTTSEFISTPPVLPPRRRTPEQTGESGKKLNIREMSQSPTRR